MQNLPATITAGVVTGVLNTILALSYATLVFSGDLSGFLARGIGLVLLSAIVTIVVIGVASSRPGITSGVQNVAGIILALTAASIAAEVSDPTADTTFVTVIVASGLASLLTGLLMIAVGKFDLTGLVRALPYPVVGGLLAGTGWLLFAGGLSVATDQPIGAEYMGGDMFLKWVPAVALGAVIFGGLRRSKHPLTLPLIVAAFFALFYIAFGFTNTSIASATEQGFLLGKVSDGGLLEPVSLAELPDVEWTLIFGNMGGILTVLAISIISLILNITGLEVVVGEDIDLNHELRTAGSSNVLVGLFGGFIGFHGLSLTALAHRIGTRSRLFPLIGAGVVAITLISGSALLQYFPKPVLGGMLVFLGIAFMAEWLVDNYSELPRSEYVIIWIILLTVVLVGFIEGVVVGVLAAIILFVLDYSQMDIVKHQFTGKELHSTIRRSPVHSHLLETWGGQILIFQLQGFIFFGTANRLLNQVRNYEPELRYLILDFRQVTKLDSSAVYSLSKLQRLADAENFTILLSAVPTTIRQRLANLSGKLFSDLDRALAYAEEEVLSEADIPAEIDTSIITQMESFMPHNAIAIIAHMERQTFPQGTVIAKPGDPSDAIYFVESGLLAVDLFVENSPVVRMRTVAAGAIVGEVGLYLGINRSSYIVAEEDSVVFVLTRNALDKIRKDHPKIAVAFHEHIAQLLAEQLV
ncbi:MAG: cyclic nucleotide-binding domain-containing protein, partial [Chloroflexi bacterium]|nr:cyclic nucleotide-binding domain-containing protein [Chloroflexota bacterium]